MKVVFYDYDPLLKKRSDEIMQLDERFNEILYMYNSLEKEQYQLREIKKTRQKLKKGDLFIVNPFSDLFFYGIVLNCNVNNKVYGDNLVIICILKITYDGTAVDFSARGLCEEDILVGPKIVMKEYWSKGYFYNIGQNVEDLRNIKYGFYKNRTCVDEFGISMEEKVSLLGSYGLTTIVGIASELHEKLIIDHSFLSNDELHMCNNYWNDLLVKKKAIPDSYILDKETFPLSLVCSNESIAVIIDDLDSANKLLKLQCDDFEGNGYDWENAVRRYLQQRYPNKVNSIVFDSEAGMFCMSSTDIGFIKLLAVEIATLIKEDGFLHYFSNKE